MRAGFIDEWVDSIYAVEVLTTTQAIKRLCDDVEHKITLNCCVHSALCVFWYHAVLRDLLSKTIGINLIQGPMDEFIYWGCKWTKIYCSLQHGERRQKLSGYKRLALSLRRTGRCVFRRRLRNRTWFSLVLMCPSDWTRAVKRSFDSETWCFRVFWVHWYNTLYFSLSARALCPTDSKDVTEHYSWVSYVNLPSLQRGWRTAATQEGTDRRWLLSNCTTLASWG